MYFLNEHETYIQGNDKKQRPKSFNPTSCRPDGIRVISPLDEERDRSNVKVKDGSHSVKYKTAQASHPPRDIILMDNSISEPDKELRRQACTHFSFLLLKGWKASASSSKGLRGHDPEWHKHTSMFFVGLNPCVKPEPLCILLAFIQHCKYSLKQLYGKLISLSVV